MAHMVMLMVDNDEQRDTVLKAWAEISIDEAVLIDSKCFHRAAHRQRSIPMRYMFESREDAHRHCSVTLLCTVENDTALEACIQATDRAVETFDKRENILLTTWPLSTIRRY